jgi:hypothetical protein
MIVRCSKGRSIDLDGTMLEEDVIDKAGGFHGQGAKTTNGITEGLCRISQRRLGLVFPCVL